MHESHLLPSGLCRKGFGVHICEFDVIMQRCQAETILGQFCSAYMPPDHSCICTISHLECMHASKANGAVQSMNSATCIWRDLHADHYGLPTKSQAAVTQGSRGASSYCGGLEWGCNYTYNYFVNGLDSSLPSFAPFRQAQVLRRSCPAGNQMTIGRVYVPDLHHGHIFESKV